MDWTIDRGRTGRRRWYLRWRGERTRLDMPTRELAEAVAEALNASR